MGDCIGETHPKARKDHQCDLCGYPIPEGTVHTARQGKDDGRVYTFRMHDSCELLTREWDEEEWEYSEPWTFRDIPEFITGPVAASAGEGETDE